PERPVDMASSYGHPAWVNSAALALPGTSAATPEPSGGRIERGRDGAPTGILREAAVRLLTVPMPVHAPEQVGRGLARAPAPAGSEVISGIVDARAEPWMLDGYERFAARGALTVRVRAAVEVHPERGAGQLAGVEALRARQTGPLVRVTAIKLYVDGVIE